MSHKLWEYLVDENNSPEEKRKMLKVFRLVIFPLLGIGILFFVALLLGLIKL